MKPPATNVLGDCVQHVLGNGGRLDIWSFRAEKLDAILHNNSGHIERCGCQYRKQLAGSFAAALRKRRQRPSLNILLVRIRKGRTEYDRREACISSRFVLRRSCLRFGEKVGRAKIPVGGGEGLVRGRATISVIFRIHEVAAWQKRQVKATLALGRTM